MSLGGGLVFNDERGVDVEPTQNTEALFVFQTSFYTYDRPKTNLDINLQYYPSLSNIGRNRLQLDASVKREFLKDLFVGLSLYNTYDSRPPNPTANTNDIGVVVSIGWSY
jgi:DNA phosphorothioation-dependent restriction protein DptG